MMLVCYNLCFLFRRKYVKCNFNTPIQWLRFNFLALLDFLKTSKAIKAEEAHSLGLVDALVSRDKLVSAARQWALDIVDRRRPWVASLYKTDKIESLGEAREILKFAKTQAQRRAPNLKHPLVCIDVIEHGIVTGPRAGLLKVVTCLQFFFLLLKLLYPNLNYNVSNLCRKLKPLKDWWPRILARA